MFKIVCFLILFLILIKYQSPIYHYLFSFPKLYFWLHNSGNNNYFKIKQKELIEYGNMESYFDSYKMEKFINILCLYMIIVYY